MSTCRPCLPLVALLLAAAAHAGGLRPAELPRLAPTPGPITIDGKLDDWAGLPAQVFRPIDPSQSQDSGPLLTDLQAHPRQVAWRLAYDAEALYLALDWTTPAPPRNTTPETKPDAWAEGGDGFELHVAGDRSLHLACWPGPDPAKPIVRLKRDPQRDWQPAPTVEAAMAVCDHGYTEELKVPWALLTGGGLPAEGKLALAVDFAWASLGPQQLAQLPLDLRKAFTHQTLSFLTTDAKLFNQGYLPRPGMWGWLRFAETARAPRLETSLIGTGLTDLTARRCPKPPVIDGDLSDWREVPFAEAILAPDFLGRRRVYALAAQFDDQALYLAGRGSTPKPLNLARESGQNGFGGGDALQVRLQLGAKVVNLCAWFDTAAGAPALTADGVDLTQPFLLRAGAKEAFGTSPEGYTQEIAIPWAALGAAAPKVGDRWRATFQPWWAGLDPRFTLTVATTLARPDPLAVNYTMPGDGEVTLGLYDAAGALRRWLTHGQWRHAGANRDTWNGLDQYGAPLPAGDYTVKAAWHPPLKLDYRLSLMNPGTPPWPTPDGHGDWLGDEGSPQAVATDGDWVWLGSPGSEKGFGIIALDGSGQRQWGIAEDFNPRCVSLALDGDDLFALYSGPELTEPGNRFNGHNAVERAILVCRDKRTGRPKRFSVDHPRLKLATWPYLDQHVGLWDLRVNHAFTPAVYGGQPRYFADDVGEPTGAIGLAVAGGKVWVSRIDLGRLLAYDEATGAPAGELTLPDPAGLAALPDGRLLAVSGKRLVRVDPATGTVTPVVETGLSAPDSVCVDRNGAIYVSDWGDSFQVKVFAPDGKPLRAIGKPGGRPWTGAWDASGMLVPRGIGVTNAGRLWVAEDDTLPKRISVWDAASGQLVRDYLGPTPYGGGTYFAADPTDASIIYSCGLRLKVDTEKRTAQPLAITTRRMSKDQPFALNAHNCIVAGQQIVRRGGQEYFVVNGENQIVIMRRRGQEFIPCAAVGCVQRYVTDDGSGKQVWDSDIGYHMLKHWYPDCFAGHAGQVYSWTDRNGDGLVQPDEITWIPTLTRNEPWHDGARTEWLLGWGGGFGPDWSIYYSGSCRSKTAVWRLDVSGWTPDGAPTYDLSQLKLLLLEPRPFCVSGLYVNHENKLFVAYGYEGNEARGNRDALRCYDRDGHLQWALAMPATRLRDDVHMENVCGEYEIPGLGNVLGTWLWHGNFRPYLITSDGLYVGTVLDDTKLGPAGLWDESYRYFYQQPDGTPMFVNGGNQANHIHRVEGLTGGGRFSQALTLSAADVAAAAQARTLAVGAPAAQPVLKVAWLDTPPTIDGDLSDWQMDAGVRLDAGDGRSAKVALGRDAENLYLAYRVRKEQGFANQGANWQTLFISGDCVDLMLAADAKADPHRAGPTAGDQRLVLGLYGGQPIAVRYRPVSPGATDGATLLAARFDSITRLTEAKVVVVPEEGSYTVEAAVPLRSLGIDPTGTADLRGDVGVIFADETGRNRSLRLYYYNRQTGMTADLTTEASLTPREWGAVEMPLGRNLLRNSSFAEPLTKNMADGWQLEFAQNGATARIVDGGRSGRRALLLEETQPTVFEDKAYNLEDYGAFINSANGGKGPAHVSVAQRVPVQPGHKYTLRMWYHCDGMVDERKDKGHPRGYNAFGPWVYWAGAKRGQPSAVWVANEQHNQPEWRCLLNAQANFWSVLVPYTVPEGCHEAVVALKMTGASALAQARIWVDDVEFVEVP
jgi:outer membrane protein assembly factor BamB